MRLIGIRADQPERDCLSDACLNWPNESHCVTQRVTTTLDCGRSPRQDSRSLDIHVRDIGQSPWHYRTAFKPQPPSLRQRCMAMRRTRMSILQVLVPPSHPKRDMSAKGCSRFRAHSPQQRVSGLAKKSGWRESNSHPKLGKLMCCHYTTAAKNKNRQPFPVYSAFADIAIDSIQLH